jgi:hypothetical protein
MSPLPLCCSTIPIPKDHFIAYAFHRTRLRPSVTSVVLYLSVLQCLDSQGMLPRSPAAKRSSGQLFISTFMLASKIICHDAFSNKS